MTLSFQVHGAIARITAVNLALVHPLFTYSNTYQGQLIYLKRPVFFTDTPKYPHSIMFQWNYKYIAEQFMARWPVDWLNIAQQDKIYVTLNTYFLY